MEKVMTAEENDIKRLKCIEYRSLTMTLKSKKTGSESVQMLEPRSLVKET